MLAVLLLQEIALGPEKGVENHKIGEAEQVCSEGHLEIDAHTKTRQPTGEIYVESPLPQQPEPYNTEDGDT